MEQHWFTNKGQALQVIFMGIGLILGGFSAYVAAGSQWHPSAGLKFIFFAGAAALTGSFFAGIAMLLWGSPQTAAPSLLQPPASEIFLALQDIEPLRKADAEYKSKLYITVKNDSGKHLHVLTPVWESQSGDLPVRPMARLLWHNEGPSGYLTGRPNSWDMAHEVDNIQVRPGQVIRTWIGVQETVPDGDLRRAVVTRRTGTLVIPLKVNGRTVEQRIRL